MNITQISVKRPAAMWMVVILLVGLGIIGYKSMGASLYPSMDQPFITVMTTYSGANAEDVKKDVVKPIEDAVSNISGLDTVNSTSKEGVGIVTIKFKTSANPNTAYLDVQKAVENGSGRLPKNADKPSIIKYNTNDMPILILTVNGDVRYDELYNEADILKQNLEKVSGVGSVNLMGGEKKQLKIKLDKTAMEYYGIGVNDLINKLNSANMNMPVGTIKQDKMDQAVRVIGQFNNINDAKNLLLHTGNGGSVRLGDIAEINLESPDAEALARFKNKKTVAVTVAKQSDANIVEVGKNVKEQLKVLEKSIPSGIKVDVAFDNTVFITSALNQVNHNLIEGIITTAIVLYLFFRSLRSSIVVLVAIPTSLIASFFMMYKLNFTLNMMSLMGLSLVVGTLVDDSIVVLESIQRKLDLGQNPMLAAVEGRKEVGMAAIAISLCDVVVFLPISLVNGMIGQLLKEFGITIVIATMFSLLVSFTITPMLASRLLKSGKKEEKVKKNGFFTKLLNKYRKLLIWSLENRGKVLVSTILCIVFSIALIPMGLLKTEGFPTTDQSFFQVSISLAPGSTLKQTDEKIAEIEKCLSNTKEIKNYLSLIGNSGSGGGSDKSTASIYVNLVPKKERKKSQSQVAADVRKFSKKMSGADINVLEGNGGGDSGKPISISIKGSNSDTLKDLSKEVENIVKSVPGIVDVSNSSNVKNSELKVTIDSLAAAQNGVSTSDVGSYIRTALSGSKAGIYRANNEENDIVVKFMDGQIKNIDDIRAIKIINQSGQQVALDQVAEVKKADGPTSISRENKQDVAVVSANLQGKVLGQAAKNIDAKLKSLNVPTGCSVEYGGSKKSMDESNNSLILALVGSLVLVYMILVVLYESFLTPFIRMISLPCAIIGAFGLLAVTGQTLNTISMIGLIMLEGLASKNGTLLIDYTNILMKKGMSLKDALIESGTTRLRPIIMTSATMVVAMLPVALSLGEGSEMKQSMAVLIIGGMIASTALSPIVLPVVYTLMDDLTKFIFKRKRNKVDNTEVKQYEV